MFQGAGQKDFPNALRELGGAASGGGADNPVLTLILMALVCVLIMVVLHLWAKTK